MTNRRRTPAARLLLLLAFTVGPTASRAEGIDGDVWITMSADAFLAATDVFSGTEGLASLPRLAEAEGVVLTRLRESSVAQLSETLHQQLRRCGGFISHGSYAEGVAELERLTAPRPALGALPFAIDVPGTVAAVDSQISASNIFATITSLSTNFPNRYHSWASTHGSHLWIRDLWAGYAAARPEITVELVSHTGWSSPTPQPSVVLTIPGSTTPSEIIVLGAHQDSIVSSCSGNSNCNAPGADDDASGVATISEVLRALLVEGIVPQRTVKFMAYAAEEVGLRGSNHLASMHQASGANVVAVMQLDMTGYEGSANDIYMITDNTDAELTTFVQTLASTYLPEYAMGTTYCNYGCSDHDAWDNRGFRTVFPFEAKFLPGSAQYNPSIHSAQDTVATIGNSGAHAAKFARLAAAFVVEASLELVPEIFEDDFESADTSAWSASVP